MKNYLCWKASVWCRWLQFHCCLQRLGTSATKHYRQQLLWGPPCCVWPPYWRCGPWLTTCVGCGRICEPSAWPLRAAMSAQQHKLIKSNCTLTAASTSSTWEAELSDSALEIICALKFDWIECSAFHWQNSCVSALHICVVCSQCQNLPDLAVCVCYSAGRKSCII